MSSGREARVGLPGSLRAVPDVLLATDADWIHDEVDAALAAPGTAVRRVRTGADVLPAAKEKAPQLVVLDLQIGNMGGMAACMALHLEESGGRLPHLPVLMLLDRQADVFLAQRSAADGWLIKPLDAFRLRRAAQALLRGRHVPGGARDERSASTCEHPDVAARRVGAPPERRDCEPERSGNLGAPTTGVWLSLVERCVRDAEVVGSNPATPTSRAAVQALFPFRPGKCPRRSIPRFPAFRSGNARRDGPPQPGQPPSLPARRSPTSAAGPSARAASDPS